MPIEIADLPTVNAGLNALAAVFLFTGFALIRKRRIEAHRRAMLAAFTCSVVFLMSYLYYHFHAGTTRFPGQGAWRFVYFSILLSHTVLAALVPFLASITLFQALKSRFRQHRKIARWTLPIWLYVSVTGVIIYWMLYRMSW